MLTFLGVVLGALPGVAADNGDKAIFARHWQVSKEFTLAVAEAMPAEGYDFKPHPEEMSFGKLMIHIADENSRDFARAQWEPRRSLNPPRLINDLVQMLQRHGVKLFWRTCRKNRRET
ncbi:MAG: hypothetical protein JJE04_20600 [Acidobacteriia bacterium]|nr:hypothetical protein [Terriglobia bacterium]